MAKMTRAQWRKTPYAGSKARDPDASLGRLLDRYGIVDYEMAQGKGPSGRRAIRLRCSIKNAAYRFLLETLDADVEPEELLQQVKRALYYQLKSVLELASVFYPLEEALFAFREMSDGSTLFEATMPHMAQLTADNAGQLLLPLREQP